MRPTTVLTSTLLCCALGSGLAHAQDDGIVESPRPNTAPARDELLVGTRADHFPGSGFGFAPSIDWIRRSGPTVTRLGIAGSALPGARWALLNAGYARRLGPSWVVAGELNVGPGSDGGGSFAYRMFQAGIQRVLRPGRLFLGFEARRYAISSVRGTLLSPDLDWVLGRSAVIEARYTRSIGGNLDTELVALRVDVLALPTPVYAGLATGHSAPVLFDAFGEQIDREVLGISDSITEIYGGIRVPLGVNELMTTASVVRVGEGPWRRSLSLTLRLPLTTRPRGPR